MNQEELIRGMARARLAELEEWLEKAQIRITIDDRANVTLSRGGSQAVAFVDAIVEFPLAP